MNLLLDKVRKLKRKQDQQKYEEERIFNLGAQNLRAVLKKCYVPGVQIECRFGSEHDCYQFVIAVDKKRDQALYLSVCPYNTKRHGAPVYIVKAANYDIKPLEGYIKEVEFKADVPTNSACIKALEQAMEVIGGHIAYFS